MIKVKLVILSTLLYLVATLAFAQMAKASSDAASWGTWIVDADAIAAMVQAPSEEVRVSEVQDLLTLAATRNADTQKTVDYWNVVAAPYRWAEDLYEVSKNGPPGGRPFALMSVAIYDAVVATSKAKEAAGLWSVPTNSGVEALAATSHMSFPSEHVAIAIAASEVLSYVKPDHADRFRAMAEEAIQSRLLAGVNVQSDIDAGRTIGQAVADAVIAYGEADDSNLPWEYSSRPTDTLYAVEKPIAPNLGKAKTIAIENGAQFRAPPPPAYGSDELNAQLDEIRAVERNLPNIRQATTWARFDATFPVWTEFANKLLFESRQADDTARMAKIYAAIGVARSDAEIACFDSKYTYWLARPVHLDPSLQTIVPTPPHPSYPSAHSCVTSAAAHTFAHLFPNSSDEALGLAQQAGQSRILGGIHFQADNQAGLTLGESVAGVVIDKVMSMTRQGSIGNMSIKSAEDLARAYIAARNAYSVDRSIMTDDVKIVELGDSLSVEDVASWLKYAKAQDLRWFVEDCETTTATQVDCSFTMANKVSDAYGYGQVDGGVFQFSIGDGKISEVNLNINLSFWGPNVFMPAMEYIESNYSENMDKLYSDKGTIGISDEGLELWRIYTDEFVGVVKASNN